MPLAEASPLPQIIHNLWNWLPQIDGLKPLTDPDHLPAVGHDEIPSLLPEAQGNGAFFILHGSGSHRCALLMRTS